MSRSVKGGMLVCMVSAVKLIPCNLPCIVSSKKYFCPASPETGVAVVKEGNTSILLTVLSIELNV